jgi:hypothetical protein
MGTLDCSLTVAACVLSRCDREQIHLVARQIKQNVVWCGNCRHAQAPLPRLSSVVLRSVYSKEYVVLLD